MIHMLWNLILKVYMNEHELDELNSYQVHHLESTQDILSA